MRRWNRRWRRRKK